MGCSLRSYASLYKVPWRRCLREQHSGIAQEKRGKKEEDSHRDEMGLSIFFLPYLPLSVFADQVEEVPYGRPALQRSAVRMSCRYPSIFASFAPPCSPPTNSLGRFFFFFSDLHILPRIQPTTRYHEPQALFPPMSNLPCICHLRRQLCEVRIPISATEWPRL